MPFVSLGQNTIHLKPKVQYSSNFYCIIPSLRQVVHGIFERGVQQIQLRTKERENRDLGAVAPLSEVLLILQMSEPLIFIRFLRIYFPQNWEFGSALYASAYENMFSN
jgi:hypothetical protein